MVESEYEIPVPLSVRPPSEAYRYWPKGDLICAGEGKSIQRYIYYRTIFTQYELDKLEKFKADLSKLLKGKPLPEFLCDQELLRLLHGTHFDRKKTAKALVDAIAWREANLSNSYHTLYPRCKHLLV
jgi:hypothetical protein